MPAAARSRRRRAGRSRGRSRPSDDTISRMRCVPATPSGRGSLTPAAGPRANGRTASAATQSAGTLTQPSTCFSAADSLAERRFQRDRHRAGRFAGTDDRDPAYACADPALRRRPIADRRRPGHTAESAVRAARRGRRPTRCARRRHGVGQKCGPCDRAVYRCERRREQRAAGGIWKCRARLARRPCGSRLTLAGCERADHHAIDSTPRRFRPARR